MPSARRIRLMTLTVVALVMLFLYYNTGARRVSPSSTDFYRKTMDAMRAQSPLFPDQSETGPSVDGIPADHDRDRDRGAGAGDATLNTELRERLSQLAKEANKKANEKAGPKPDLEKIKAEAEAKADKAAAAERAPEQSPITKSESAKKTLSKEEEAEEKTRRAEEELDRILQEAPVVIFSKSYCPHSKRAKGILLDKYVLGPRPFVQELDGHPLMDALQDLLETRTGRRTVPNVLVNRVSIGGADQIIDLDNKGELIRRIEELGENKIKVKKWSSGRVRREADKD